MKGKCQCGGRAKKAVILWCDSFLLASGDPGAHSK